MLVGPEWGESSRMNSGKEWRTQSVCDGPGGWDGRGERNYPQISQMYADENDGETVDSSVQ